MTNSDLTLFFDKPKFISYIGKTDIDKFQKVISKIEGYSKTNIPILDKGIILAIASGIQALYNRELDPLYSEHIMIFKEIITEVRTAYFEIEKQFVDEETWLLDCCDYAVKKAYYLDWKLYLSQVCY